MASPKTKIASALAAASMLVAVGIASQFEGTLYQAYYDPVGILTVCEGHTGPGIVVGKRYTRAECDAFLRKDMQTASAVVDSCITGPLTVNQRAALVDFAFNVGPGGKGVKDGLCSLKSGREPSIRRYFNAGNTAAGCAEFNAWNSNKLRGIARRRTEEARVCSSK